MSTTTTYQAKTESGPERGPRGTSGPALRGRDLSAPRTGNTGGKLTTLSPSFAHCERSLSIHWLRVTHPMSAMRILRASLVRLFGEPDEIRGRWFYEHGERFANGILLLWGETVNADQDGDPSEHALCIDVPGGALDALDFYDRFNLCQQLSLGGRVTRLDIALDCQACTGTVGLIDRIINACDTGCMVGARRWKTISESNGGERSGYGVSIGLRGSKGSGRFLRAYDKGLESGEAPEGIWERYEVEFTGDSAAEVGADIFRAIGNARGPRIRARGRGVRLPPQPRERPRAPRPPPAHGVVVGFSGRSEAARHTPEAREDEPRTLYELDP